MQILQQSNKGNYREENQDRVGSFSKNGVHFAILCDGMGGHFGGSIASSTTVNSFGIEFNNNYQLDSKNAKNWFFETTEKIKKQMRLHSEQDFTKTDMGTTLTAVLIFPEEKNIIIFNIGDSRTYAFTKKKEIIQLTVDHNWYNQLVNEGLNKTFAHRAPHSQALTSSIGPTKKTTIEMFEITPESYKKISHLFLTSDGIHGFVPDDELQVAMSNTKKNNEQKMLSILEMAELNNSNDNMSIILIDLIGEENE
ncbi:PP2C family protein-serine/threonine phosphatase [Mycoplasma crocodyli]|uniref:Protein phosphatase n=1 Tax=Mycoplasma crocodyli (strain ATCC 51981 / MP145) TaxID=512564 RepID=D5E5A9_MYCCM|nr:protein phosphatase 2C domain-containing protein [Mycoplasma crocodyli]ADE19815.1 protein phosphatase [Mycoplasma crocodyli MP145]